MSDGTHTPEGLSPEVRGVIDSIKVASGEIPRSFVESSNKGIAERIELDGRRQIFSLRGMWSRWLIIWISCILAFQALLTVGVGLKWLNFIEYKWFLPIVIGQSFLQIIGMGVIIVKFLHAHQK